MPLRIAARIQRADARYSKDRLELLIQLTGEVNDQSKQSFRPFRIARFAWISIVSGQNRPINVVQYEFHQ
jgi:hypothetical protein